MNSNTIKKSSSHAKKNSTFRNEQKQIKQLTQGLAQSRIAVKVLRELVAVLKGQMTKIETKELEDKQKEEVQLNKVIKQLREDIDKISQKKNKQIARISVLKSNSNQSRDERVVYSNLFKKLQRQIKEQEENYKNILLTAQKTKIDLQISPSKISRVEEDNNRMNNSQCNLDSHNSVSNEGYANKRIHRSIMPLNNQGQGFLITGLKQEQRATSNFSSQQRYSQGFQPHEKAKLFLKTNKSLRVHRQNSLKSNGENTIAAMDQLKKFHSRIQLLTGCESTQHIHDMFNTINEQNNSITEQVQNLNDKIFELQKQIKQFSKNNQFRKSQIKLRPIIYDFSEKSEEARKTETALCENNTTKLRKEYRRCKTKFNSQVQRQSLMDQQDEQQSLLIQICQVFGIQVENQKMSSFEIEQKNKKIDNLVSQIVFWESNNKSYLKQKQNQLKFQQAQFLFPDKPATSRLQQSRRQSLGQLNSILHKMDKFQHCEKILDKNGFYGQYFKQIHRKTKGKNKKA